jgi:starvation-inducible DNA-binding protein
MTPRLGLEGSAKVADILNSVLADETVLYVKTLNFHWNVTGENFGELHKFFQKQYEALSGHMDAVAERIRALGERPLGTLSEFSQATYLKESPGKYPEAQAMLRALLDDHETVARILRKSADVCQEKHKDAGTANFLIDLLSKHEKMAWMLRSYLE